MIDFTLTDEQRDMRAMAHDFARGEIRRVAWDLDREGAHPDRLVRAAWELGLMNLHVPERYGGAGLDRLSGVLIAEELGWGCAGIGATLAANELAGAPLLLAGSEELKRRYLGMLAEAPLLAAVALHEPDAGSEPPGSERTTAVRRKGGYVLNGSKSLVAGGSHASWYVVLASTGGDADGGGTSMFVVPRDAGVTVDAERDTLGQRAWRSASISFRDLELPADSLLGEDGRGSELAGQALALARPGSAALSVGLARAAMELARGYALERVQFGVPIAEHEAVALMLADMATRIEASRLLTWRASAAADGGAPEALLSAIAASTAARAATDVATDAVQVFGGYGFVKDYPVEKLMRDAKTAELRANASQRGRLEIASALLHGSERRPAVA